MARRRLIASLAIIGTLALTGCTGGGVVDPPTDETDPAEPAVTDEATDTDSPFDSPEAEALANCMEGRWFLDAEAYAAAAGSYLVSLGPVPLESLTASGTLILDITDESIGQSVDLTWNAVLMGIPVTVVDQSAGVGQLRWWDDGFDIENWIWGVEPVPVGDEDPSVPSPSIADEGSVFATCDGSTLVVTGEGAPLSAIFRR